MPANSFLSLLSQEEIEQQIDALEEDRDPFRSIEEWAQALYDLSPEDFFWPRELGKPCRALPGSEEKIKALRRRVRRGQSLWNRRDMDYSMISEKIQMKVEGLKNGTGKRVGLQLAGA